MLGTLTRDSFAKHLDQSFRLHTEAETQELVLIEATMLGSDRTADQPQPTSSGRQPFSLIFQGALEPVLSQRIYKIEHGEMGSLELFLVPVGQTESATHYQAVFN